MGVSVSLHNGSSDASTTGFYYINMSVVITGIVFLMRVCLGSATGDWIRSCVRVYPLRVAACEVVGVVREEGGGVISSRLFSSRV